VAAPFVKVEASKFTEVGYVGRDVESMVRDLVENAIQICQAEEREAVANRAREQAEERILRMLWPSSTRRPRRLRLRRETRQPSRTCWGLS